MKSSRDYQRGGGMQRLRDLLINRDFALLFMGRFVSQIGDGIHYFAMAWLVLDLTGSGTALGTLLMAASLPSILLAPFSGVLADTLNRKKIVVSMDIVRGLLVLTLAVIHWTGQLTLPVLYIVTILLSLSGVLFSPAIMATLPGLVKREELPKANARSAFSNSVTGTLGPIVGALLLANFGYLGIFLINGVSFLLSAISELFIRFPKQQPLAQTNNARADFFNNFKDGFRFLWKNAGLRVLIAGGLLLNFLFNPLFGVVFPYFGKEILLMPAEHFGLSQSSFPVGMLLGTMVVAVLAQKFSKIRILTGAATLQGLLVMALGVLALPAIHSQLAPYGVLLALMVPMLFMGIISVQVNVQVNTMMQETVPDGYRGRVFAMFGSLMQLASPLGMGLFGLLLGWIPVHVFFLVCGTMAVATAAAFAASPSLRILCGEEEPAAMPAMKSA